jgi:hypothetical protein
MGTYNRLNCHVFVTNRELIKAALGRLKPSARKGRATRAARHEFLRAMILCHKAARAEYFQVMRGR